MQTSLFWRLGLACAGLLVSMPMAAAQNIFFDAPGLLLKKPKPGPPDVQAAPVVWPRLDPGAVLCRTEPDLERLAAKRRGEANGPVDCRIIATPTAVQILQRKGPGRTQIAVTGQANSAGWTDVWLPEKPPAAPGAR